MMKARITSAIIKPEISPVLRDIIQSEAAIKSQEPMMFYEDYWGRWDKVDPSSPFPWSRHNYSASPSTGRSLASFGLN
jgi:hypothetical protein